LEIQCEEAKFYVDPILVEKTGKDVCMTFEVNVIIENATDFQAFDFNLTWDNSLITLVDVELHACASDVT
jgi:hypothetical protein